MEIRSCLLLSFIFPVSFLSAQPDTPTTDSGFYASFDSTKIYYEVRGEGKPVVLVHGFIVDGSSWRQSDLMRDLVANGFKVIVPDLRGNGRSGKPHNETAYAHDAEAKDIIGLMQHLNLKNYDAVGYSRGSIIVSRLLVLDKELHKAVLGGMGDGFTDPEWPRRIMFYEALSGKPVKELEGMVNSVKQRGLDTLVLAWLQKYQPSTGPAALKKIKQKVLVISGDKDLDNGSPEQLSKMFQSATLVFVPGEHNRTSGTKEFSGAVVSFLKEGEKAGH
jgi:pimeloyl-ACP methyl ester carboxylesterase